jgi:hypothetical protein
MRSRLVDELARLGRNNTLNVLFDTPRRLENLLQLFQPADLHESYAPGKWSVREIVCHLADMELAFGFLLRQSISEENPTIPPFRLGQWSWVYDDVSPVVAYMTYQALRSWNLTVLRALTPHEWDCTLIHPTRGQESVERAAASLAGHDLHHVAQIEKVLGTVSEIDSAWLVEFID